MNERDVFEKVIDALDSEDGVTLETYQFILGILPYGKARRLADLVEATDDKFYLPEVNAQALRSEYHFLIKGE